MTKNNINEPLKEEARQALFLKKQYIITKPLKLENVIEGGYTDDVLVRSWDNTVKYIPQNEFVSSPQDLQQTLNIGNTATGSISITNDSGSDSSYISSGNISLQTNGNKGSFNMFDWMGQTGCELNDNRIIFTQQLDYLNFLTLKYNPTSAGSTELKFPNYYEADRFFALSVNGNFADENGNIKTSDVKDDISLQTILNNNARASLNSNKRKISIFDTQQLFAPSDEFRIYSEDVSGDKRTSLQLAPNDGLNFNSQSVTDYKFGSILVKTDQVTLTRSVPVDGFGASTQVFFDDPTLPGETILKFPHKGTGEYTLATLDDVSIPSLQQVYDKGRTISTDTGLVILKTSSPNQGYTAIDGEVIEIYDNISQGINISKNKILGYGINRNNIIDFSKTTISQSTYKFPEKTDGTYVFATTSDLAIDDLTSDAKSKTQLNTEYPNAVNGFRVHCPYISTGAMIYEKASIGWLQYAATITQ